MDVEGEEDEGGSGGCWWGVSIERVGGGVAHCGDHDGVWAEEEGLGEGEADSWVVLWVR